ncbi:MBL fold metallo-hydrolase [Minwuia thermotolerans]|uniref:MBL fold metallo-hydrolase n=1 Tax=Minwuia thermotolerans TaxID=2056226 RepID=A0A2M9FZK3_9PROT|nr:MBL fold metallo-hydrolase [Minwuia thermotolerans]PJK28885.1 MBL fold metallo-hydrolase [Minwuia thermotolerans]
MSGNDDFSVRFWGVRGSIACSAPDVIRYGGNTSSLEVRAGERLLLFDGGSGLRYLGKQLAAQPPGDADLFLTHTHFDHVCGLPFFVPFFIPGWKFRVWAGHLLPALTLERVLHDMMIAPLFPVPPTIFNADIDYRDFRAGEELAPADDVVVKTCPLEHPNDATGYRVEFDGRSICYITDTEHPAEGNDPRLVEFLKDADIVIYDASYTDEEYKQRVGWGHSTWEAGMRLCDAANAKTYVVFHHDPEHDDDFMDGIARDVETARPGSVVAREGMVLRP